MEINRYNDNTSFGMSLILSRGAKAYIKNRFETKDYLELMSIMKRQIGNPKDVYVHVAEYKPLSPALNKPVGITLAARVESKVFKKKFFQSPLTVIKKAADYATNFYTESKNQINQIPFGE